jgi:prophage DNA circulation protein
MAEDLWESILFEATFGGVRVDVQSTTDQVDRTVVEHEFVHVDGAELQDKGGKAHRIDVRLIFFPVGPDDDPSDRLRRFLAAKDAGPQDFVHPIFGSLRVRVPNCRVSATAEERSTVMVEATFVEDLSGVKRVRQVGAGSLLDAAITEITRVSADLTAAIADTNAREGKALSSTVGSDAITTAKAWKASKSADSASFRVVRLQLNTLSDNISKEIDRLEVTTNVRRWAIFDALTRLNYTLRRAFDAVTTTQPDIIEVTVAAAMPLLVLVAQIYRSAREGMRHYDEILRLNDIRNPARLEAGQVIKAYAPKPSRSRRIG